MPTVAPNRRQDRPTEPDRDDWTIIGNSFLNEETDFIGTTDSTELVLKSNNVEGSR